MRPPFFPTGQLPEVEKEPTYQVMSLLGSIDHAVSHFRSCLRLYAFCKQGFLDAMEERKPLNFNNTDPEKREVLTQKMHDCTGWKIIAAQAAAMEIHQFSICLVELFLALPLCSTLISMIDENQLRLEAKTFHKTFPHAAAIRNGIAHAPEISVRRSWQRQHSFSGKFRGSTNLINPGAQIGSLIMTPGLANDTLTFTWKRSVIEIDITEEIAAKLENIKTGIFSVFLPGETGLERFTLERLRTEAR